VLNNDFHHPVHLARELSTLDHFSGGRVELGIGAGHAFTEYAAIGQQFDPPRVRKARLAEAVEAMRQLLSGESVTWNGEHYQLTDVQVKASLQPHVPFLVAVNGKQALAHAAAHADIIGLFVLGRTLADGHRHEARWQAQRVDQIVAYVREQAGDRADQLEFNALVQRIVITNDRKAAAAEIVSQVEGLSVEDALETPYLMLGTHDEIAEHLRECRERWGISYFTVRDLNAVAPIIERLSAAESRSR
jgi:probable F420-dependent oxidoreductase